MHNSNLFLYTIISCSIGVYLIKQYHLVMTKLLNLLIIFIFLSCEQRTTKPGNTDKLSSSQIKTGKKFFSYDTIIHYQSNFHDSSLVELDSRRSASLFDSIKRHVLIGNIPTNINDLLFVGRLEQMGFQKKNVDKFLFNRVDSIFIEKSIGERYATTCAQIFRDILIFKKAGKTVGIAKICFSCGDNQITGTDANIAKFGTGDDYRRLENILK